jgi:hypothetical protein
MRHYVTLSALAVAIALPGALGARCLKIEDYAGAAISPNGRYVVSNIQGSIRIIDTETDKSWEYDPDMADIHMYTNGLGNCFSNDGMMVGSTRSVMDACVWQNGEWTQLPVGDAKFNNMANGITPDGKVICGSIGVGELSADENHLILSPAVWYRNEDGSWGKPVELPHPDVDFTGRVPQYITAVCISSDGNTVAGQIVDFSGVMVQPIFYTRDAEGKWSYTLLGSEMLNPNNVTFPEFVGDAPVTPQIQDYMTDEELAAHSKAYQEWFDSGSDENPPAYEDFASAEEKAEYDADMKDYQREFLKWQSDYNRFVKAFNDCLNNGTSFVFNNVALSSDGKRYLAYTKNVVPDGVDDMGQPKYKEIHYPCVFNTEDKSNIIYDAYQGLQSSCITDDYSVLVTKDPHGCGQSYIYLKGDKNNLVSYLDYVRGISQEDAQWMVDNMTDTVDLYDPEDDRYEATDLVITGIAACTPDMKAFLSSVYYVWRDYGPDYISYIVWPGESGVGEVAASETESVRVLADGTLRVAADVESVEVYDFAGTLLYSTDATGDIRLPLASGLYIVKATTPEGVSAVKARL